MEKTLSQWDFMSRDLPQDHSGHSNLPATWAPPLMQVMIQQTHRRAESGISKNLPVNANDAVSVGHLEQQGFKAVFLKLWIVPE